jgi:hypothetical protein
MDNQVKDELKKLVEEIVPTVQLIYQKKGISKKEAVLLLTWLLADAQMLIEEIRLKGE